MGSDDGDNGAVTPDQTDMLPQGRRVIGFACEMGSTEGRVSVRKIKILVINWETFQLD